MVINLKHFYMKKLLLTLAAAAIASGSFAAALPHRSLQREAEPGRVRQLLETDKSTAKSPRLFRAASDAATLSMNWGYCEGAYNGVPMPAGELKGAIKLDVDLAKEWAGATISSISVGNPVDLNTARPDYEQMIYVYDNPIREAKIWLAEDLDKDPVIIVDAELGEMGAEWSTIELPEAYTIKADTPVYIGYTLTVPDNEEGNILPIIVDMGEPNKNGCYVYSRYEGLDNDGYLTFGQDYKWSTPYNVFTNLAIRACVNGDMLPTDIVRNYAWSVPMYTAPNEVFTALTMIQNMAANPVSSVEYTMEIQGMEPQKYTVDLPETLGYYDISKPISAEFKCATVGNNIGYRLYISAINGNPVDFSAEAIEGKLLCIEEGYPRNVVFEEATGTWCGWCVLGYAGMEYMAENYADQGFIGIAIHGGDEMDVMGDEETECAYTPLADMISGFPTAFANRNMGNEIYPDPYEMEYAFEGLKDVPAYAEISATLETGASDKELKLSTKSKFADSEENSNYAVGYTVIEDLVGPYAQTNYTSGRDGDYYGFEKLGPKVMLQFNDVARNCSKPMGIEGSLPAAIEKDKEYAFDDVITLGDEIAPSMVRVVAMVINLNNGAIENACVVKVPGYNGVDKILSSSKESAFAYGVKGEIRFRVNAANAQVYGIDGRQVAAGVSGQGLKVPAGIYVVSLNGRSVKVAVR